jgi:hypothetical protein
VRKPLKILGGGDLGVNVFVVADAFTKSAREKIESAGGTVQLIEIPPSRSRRWDRAGRGAPRSRGEGLACVAREGRGRGGAGRR